MFTGIITGVGRIAAVHALGDLPTHGKRLTIACPDNYLDDVGLGDSIALNGACMTVTTWDKATNQFCIDISAESLTKTAGLAVVGPINLEKALRANDRLGGHLVSGHVDGIGSVTHFAQVGESWELRVLVSDLRYARSEAMRRSITVSMCSLAANSTSTCSGVPGLWANGWMVFVDTGGTKGNWDAGEEIVRVQQPLDNIASIQKALTPADTVNSFTYEANGFAKSANETLVVTPNQSGSATVNRVICISIKGRPSLRAEGTTGC